MEILKAIRKSSGLSQSDFARSIGLKQGSYSMLERGKNKPTSKIIGKIIEQYEVNSSLFFVENAELPTKQVKEALSNKETGLLLGIVGKVVGCMEIDEALQAYTDRGNFCLMMSYTDMTLLCNIGQKLLRIAQQ